MGEIIYNGRSSRDIGLEVETYPSYQTPRRSYEKLHVPGRNGDLLIDAGSWENGTRSYLVSMGSLYRSYTVMMNKLSEWLHSSTTYARLEDSYEPDYYRLGVYLEEVNITNLFNQGGKATLNFDCKPQRFLKSGDEPIILEGTTKSLQIQNPTSFASLPIITVYGTGAGSFTIGSYTVSISEIGTTLTVNSDIQDAYFGGINKNSVITIPKGFPQMEPGVLTLSFSGNITKMEVLPKWFTL